MEMYQSMELSEKLIKKLRRDLFVTRVFSLVSSLLIIAVLTGGFAAYQKLNTYVEQAKGYITEIFFYMENVEPALEELSQVDMDAINATMEQMTVAFEEVDFEKLSKQVEELDIKAINAKIEALDVESLNAKIDSLDVEAINQAIQDLDTQQLSVALANLNEASQKVKELSEKLRKIEEIFSYNQ